MGVEPNAHDTVGTGRPLTSQLSVRVSPIANRRGEVVVDVITAWSTSQKVHKKLMEQQKLYQTRPVRSLCNTQTPYWPLDRQEFILIACTDPFPNRRGLVVLAALFEKRTPPLGCHSLTWRPLAKCYTKRRCLSFCDTFKESPPSPHTIVQVGVMLPHRAHEGPKTSGYEELHKPASPAILFTRYTKKIFS